MADATQFEQFLGILNNPQNGNQLQKQRDELNHILYHKEDFSSPEEMSQEVHRIAREMNEAGILPNSLNPDQIQQTFNPHAFLLPKDQSISSSQSPQRFDWSSVFQSDKQQGGGYVPQQKLDMKTELKSLQEKEFLKKFYTTLSNQDLTPEGRRDALSKLLDDLDAPSALLEQQYELLEKEVRFMAEGEKKSLGDKRKTEQDDIDKKLDIFEKQQKERQAKQRLHLKNNLPLTPEQYNRNQDLLDSLLDSTKRADALAKLRGHIHERINASGIYEELYEEEVPVGLLSDSGFTGALAQSLYQRQMLLAQEMEENNWHVPEGVHSFGQNMAATNALPQSTQNSRSGPNKLRREEKGAKKLRKEGKVVKNLIKAARIPLPVWIALGAALLLFAIVALLLIVVLSAGTAGSSQSSQPDQSLPAQQATNHPTPPDYPSNLQQAIYDTFGVQANGLYGYEYRWLWEKLWDVSNTHFIQLIKPAHITIVDGYRYATTGCSGTVGNKHCTITLHHWNTDGQEGFDVVVTHEFSHAIDSANPNSLTHASELAGAVVLDALDSKSEAQVPGGWLTWYGYLACFYHPPTLGIQLGEDYAETIAYYLNPTAIMRTACRFGPPPYSKGAHPNHYRLAQEILGIY